MINLTNAKILVADDERINVSLITKILKKNHYTVVSAFNGKEAIEIAEQEYPDLILLDINMPKLNGIEAAILIKKNPKLKNIPIIFLSGNDTTNDIVKGFDAGGVDYILKPFNISELIARISTHIKLKRALLQIVNSEKRWKSIALERDIFENLFYQSKHGVIVTNLNRKITHVNQTLLEILGYKKEDLIGQDNSILSQAGVGTKRIYEKMWKDILDPNKGVWTGELKIKKSDNTQITMLLTVDSLNSPDGEKIGYAGTYIDTEELNRLKKIQYELEKQSIYKQKLNQIIIGLCAASEYSDETTGSHVLRVNKYSEFIARKLNMDERFCTTIGMVAALHDIGKVAIQSLIQFKGRYSPEQREEMQNHTVYGADIIKKFSTNEEYEFALAKNIALHHHQSYNGTGYPKVKINGELRPLKEDEIPLEALIVSMADIYDALRSQRSYKNSMTHEKVYEIMAVDDRTGVEGKDKFGVILWNFFKENHLEFSKIYEENQ